MPDHATLRLVEQPLSQQSSERIRRYNRFMNAWRVCSPTAFNPCYTDQFEQEVVVEQGQSRAPEGRC